MPEIREINDINAPELQFFSCNSEPQLLHWFEPQDGVFIAESPKVIIRALNAGYEPISLLMERDDISRDNDGLLELCGDIPLYTGDTDTIVSLTGFKLIRGALCVFRRKKLASVEVLCHNKKRIAVLENVVNPTNIGAIFRSAAALNMEAVLLTKGCCDPLYRRSTRVSMGTIFQIEWTYLDSDTVDTDFFHRLGFRTAAMALREDSVNINDRNLMSEEKLAVILGAEGDGLSNNTINAADYTVCIPMAHGVDSLNVAAASAVAFWQLGLNNA